MPPSADSEDPRSALSPADIVEALKALNHATDSRPRVVVLRRKSGTLISVGRIETGFRLRGIAIWANPAGVTLLDAQGKYQPEHGPSEGYGLTGSSAVVLDLLSELGRNYLARLEEVDTELAGLEQKPLEASPNDILRLKRWVAMIRAEVGRALAAIAELEGEFLSQSLPGLARCLGPTTEELLRLRELASGTQTSLTDLLLLKQADQSNRLAAMANELGQVSNRIAELANVSNIRMLGLSYVMLILAVVSTIILFPNTAATILGMPSAATVPGLVVVIVLVTTAVIPLLWFISQRWIRELFRSMARYEARVGEGMKGLQEHVKGPADIAHPGESPGRPPRSP